MSCWVVPAVAAEYWGVTLDVVWDRIYSDLVPHKTDRGFVVLDVDPWRTERNGALSHNPPATYVAADDCPADVLVAQATISQPIPVGDPLFDFPENLYLAFNPSSEDAEASAHEDAEPSDFDDDQDDEDDDEMDDLPELDEEESATFGRLSWQDVRQSVSRTRKPPPARA